MTTTTYKGITHWTAAQNQPEVVVNEAMNVLDAAVAGKLTHDMASDADYTLSVIGARPREWQFKIIQINDTGVVLTGAVNIILPNTSSGLYFFFNNTAQTLTIKHAAGTGIAFLTGERGIVESAGTNVLAWTTPAVI